MCFVSAIFPKYSREQQMEKCVEGKQYRSKSLLNGACIACPPNWKSCYNEPIDDQKRCVDSCRGRSLFYIFIAYNLFFMP